MIFDFNYHHEILTAATEALENLDVDRLEELRDYTKNWMMSDEEKAALVNLLNQMAESAARLEFHGE